jgi:hypothetical protein
MSTYLFLTKRKKRKTPWRIPRRSVEKRIKYVYNNIVGLTSTANFNDVWLIESEYNLFEQVIKTVTDGRIVEYEYDDLEQQGNVSPKGFRPPLRRR